MHGPNGPRPRWRENAAGLLQSAALLSLLCGTLQAHSSGPPPRSTGAPGDTADACASCHKGLAVNGGQGSVKIVLPNGNSYTPGVNQRIKVQVSDSQQRRWGFQMSARLKSDLSNGQAGDFQPTDGFTQVVCDNGAPKPCTDKAMVQFIEHTRSVDQSRWPMRGAGSSMKTR